MSKFQELYEALTFETNKPVFDLFAKLFQARDFFHLSHLKTQGAGSYAAHVALNDAYDKILGLVDGIVESWQGSHGKLADITLSAVAADTDPVVYITSLVKYIEVSRKSISESWLQNEIDEVQKLLTSTLYKLENLK